MVRLRDPGSLDLRLQLTRLSILDWLEEDVNVNASFSIHIFYLLYLYIYYSLPLRMWNQGMRARGF